MNRLQRRGAFTLVELVSVILAVGMLLVLSASLLHNTLAANRSALDHLRRIRSVEKFMGRLRVDAQRATEVIAEDNRLIVRTKDSELVYEMKGRKMTRSRSSNGEVVGSDEWQLPSAGKVTWEVDRSGAIGLLRGKIEFTGEPVEFGGVEVVSRIGMKKDADAE